MQKTEPQTVPNILLKFAEALTTEVRKNRLEIPVKFGCGYCAGFVFNTDIRMLISNYELKEEITVANPDIDTSKRMLFFKFQHIFGKTVTGPAGAPSVLIATSRINTDEVIAIHSNTATINIEVAACYLQGLFGLSEKSPILQSLLRNTQPLLFEQLIYPSLQQVVDEIVNEPVDENFQLFFLRIKAEELVCRLLMELKKRDKRQLYPLNTHDIQTLYRVKTRMLEQLESPPVIEQLAADANMSPSKLKRLFRQVFGNSIFSYYQQFRMKEAARLLTEEKLSVSDTGYRLGFTNLSHFSRVFEQHTGMKPKRYSIGA